MRAFLIVLPALLLGACLRQPSDADQIRALVRQSVAAYNRGDLATAYRLTDLDFRAVCPRERYPAVLESAWQAKPPLRVVAIDDVSVHWVHGTARVMLASPDGTHAVERQFVKDAGRWYLYEDAAACGAAPTRPV
ncbi:MAG TPA: hypothetical protein VFA70_04620 [Dehalococcoidia bacterium]|nr:hypothetical protein [Dehalococcoidia bacterium]